MAARRDRSIATTVRTTPALFVMLAAAYHDRTDDTEFIQTIWRSIEGR